MGMVGRRTRRLLTTAAIVTVMTLAQAGLARAADTVTTFADSNIDLPGLMAMGRDGRVWWNNWKNNSIGNIADDGTMNFFESDQIDGPFAIRGFRDGNLWFTSVRNNRIGKITPEGQVTTYTDAGVNHPLNLTVGPD